MELPDGIAPIRFYALAGRPVMEVRTAEGGLGVMELDPETGAFVFRYDLHTRLYDGGPDIDVLDEPAFAALVSRWRTTLMAERVAAAIAWSRTGDGEFPYRAEFRGCMLTLRVNDFPAEPLYSVLCEGQNLGDLEDWPSTWVRSD
jgi:hypothetical protein